MFSTYLFKYLLHYIVKLVRTTGLSLHNKRSSDKKKTEKNDVRNLPLPTARKTNRSPTLQGKKNVGVGQMADNVLLAAIALLPLS